MLPKVELMHIYLNIDLIKWDVFCNQNNISLLLTSRNLREVCIV